MTKNILLLTPLFSFSTDCKHSTAPSDRFSHCLIRAAQTEDLTVIAEILADSFHSQGGIFGWAYPLLRLGIYEDLRNRLRSNSPHQICLVAARATETATAGISSDANELVGTIEMGVRSTDPLARERCQYLYLSNLAVRAVSRRRGVAGELLLNCERVALTWGFQDLYLHVLENNHQARQLYFKLGYRLHQVNLNWNAWLLRRPRQLFLHKHLERS